MLVSHGKRYTGVSVAWSELWTGQLYMDGEANEVALLVYVFMYMASYVTKIPLDVFAPTYKTRRL